MTEVKTLKLPISSTEPAMTDDDPRSPANIERRKTLKLAERDEKGRLYPGSVLERAGRPEGPAVGTLARRFTTEAINCLAEIMDDPKAPPAARVSAAQSLLDRGHGKAPVQIDLNTRANFADFLRDVGLAANYERDHPVVAEAQGSDE